VAPPSLATTLASLPCDELIGLVDLLWMKGDHERRMVCVELLELYRDRLTAADVALLERLLRDARTWTLTELANRGIRDTMIVACDGLPGLPQAIEAT
jgi:hypothetical protein